MTVIALREHHKSKFKDEEFRFEQGEGDDYSLSYEIFRLLVERKVAKPASVLIEALSYYCVSRLGHDTTMEDDLSKFIAERVGEQLTELRLADKRLDGNGAA